MTFRKVLIAMALAFAAVSTLAVSPASAATFEVNIAVVAEPPSGGATGCTSIYEGTSGCLQAAGDILWVVDNHAGYSSAMEWANFENGVQVRSGVCINSSGMGTTARCNKNFLEGSTIWGKPCLYSGTGRVSCRSSFEYLGET